jgi:hypothetical protein
MNTVDGILPQLVKNIKVLQPLIPKKDKKILISLEKQTSRGIFLTANQANLLVKILKENLEAVTTVFTEAESVISENKWSKDFRVVEKIRKIYLDGKNHGRFVVEFTFNAGLKEKIIKLNPVTQGHLLSEGSKYFFALTETNIFRVVEAFIGEKFEIDGKIMDFYQEIVDIKNKCDEPLDIFSTANEKLKKIVENSVCDVKKENLLKLQDRKIQYQYQISEKIVENSLSAKIANRRSRKIYLNPQENPLDEVLDSLKTLDRFPLMLIFEGHNSATDKKMLKSVENSINSIGLDGDIGIYFRYDKENDKESFNQEVASLGYNKNLTDATMVVGISNSKLPKFLVKMQWKPQAVITFTNNFKVNKSSVYCTDVDLVVYYTERPPLDEKVNAIL